MYEKSLRELKSKLKIVENEHELLKLELQSRSVLFALFCALFCVYVCFGGGLLFLSAFQVISGVYVCIIVPVGHSFIQ